MKRIMFLAALAATVTAAHAQYVVRGEFNSWGGTGDVAMANLGGGLWQGTVTGLTVGTGYEFKVTTPDWSDNAPGSNARAYSDASGNLLVNFWETAAADGWNPSSGHRVGYDNGNFHGWDIMGSFDGWVNPLITLTHQGSGLYTGSVVLNPGTYFYKFRKAGDWGVSIGDNFGNSAQDIQLNVGATSMYEFKLDVPNGRYTANAVPEPASMAVLGLGAAALLRRRRR